MLTYLTIIKEGRIGELSLFLYGTKERKTKAFDFFNENIGFIEAKFEATVRAIETAPITYSHPQKWKLLEEKIWEMKFLSAQIRLACYWDKKPHRLIIFYGIKKKSQKWPSQEMENVRVELKKYLIDRNNFEKGVRP